MVLPAPGPPSTAVIRPRGTSRSTVVSTVPLHRPVSTWTVKQRSSAVMGELSRGGSRRPLLLTESELDDLQIGHTVVIVVLGNDRYAVGQCGGCDPAVVDRRFAPGSS